MPTRILAGSTTQARAYIRDKGLNPTDYRPLSEPQQLRGTRSLRVIRVGSWRPRPDLGEIGEALYATEARVEDDSTW